MGFPRYLIVVYSVLCIVSVQGGARADSQQSTELKRVSTATLVESNQLASVLAEETKANQTDSETGHGEATAPHTGRFLLQAAIQRALTDHPGLAALKKEYLAMDNIAWQEGRRPNPELEFELGEFGGTGESGGIRSIATSVTYTQAIERGGKREKRQTVAALERELVYWDIRELEFEIESNVRLAYRRAQIAEFQCNQLERYSELINTVKQTIAAGVEAGRNPRLEIEKIEIEIATLDIEKSRAGRSLELARAELAGAMGETDVHFRDLPLLDGVLPDLPEIKDLDLLLEVNPALERYDAEYNVLCAMVDLEHAGAVPDMSLSGGITRLEESSEAVFSVGVALDLPWHDRNEGNISAAGYRLERIEDDLAAARRDLKMQLMAGHRSAAADWANHSSYGELLLPAAREVLSLTEEGYQYGKFGVMDVLDAQRTLLELEVEQSDALVEYFESLAELEALLNHDLFSGNDSSTGTDGIPGGQPEANNTTNEEHFHADH